MQEQTSDKKDTRQTSHQASQRIANRLVSEPMTNIDSMLMHLRNYQAKQRIRNRLEMHRNGEGSYLSD